MRIIKLLLPIIGLIVFAQSGRAQKISPSEREAVIDSLVRLVDDYYIFPEDARKMADLIRRLDHGHRYDTARTGTSLAGMLTADLRSISHDGHLGVDYSPTVIPVESLTAPSQESIDQFRLQGVRNNFGFRKLQMLEGNIGLLQLDVFWPADWIKETATGAMAFLSNADAVILDLRQNHGFADGSILIESYFFKESVHLSDYIDRDAKTTRQSWTMPIVPGTRLDEKELYILVSHDTFSAGEDFTYNMQSQGRAKVIGQSTGGGAHGTKGYRLTDHFTAAIPCIYSINPVTKTDWEGKGVQPDVAVPAEQALLTAQVLALQSSINRSTSDSGRAKELKSMLGDKQKELEALKRK